MSRPAIPTPSAEMRERMDAIGLTAEHIERCDDGGASLLDMACSMGDLPRVWRLAELGALVKHISFATVRHDDIEMVLLLFAYGADAAGSRRNTGETLLWVARSAGMVRALLAAGCDATVRNKHGRTALNSVDVTPAVLRVLAEEGGADAWAVDDFGLLALHAHAGNPHMAETVLALMLASAAAHDDPAGALTRALCACNDQGLSPLLVSVHAPEGALTLLARLATRDPALLRTALSCPSVCAPGFVLDRACLGRAAAAAAAACAQLESDDREAVVEPDAAALLAVFDECLRARVKRISAGLKSAVPLPAHNTHNAPLDIVSEYLGFSLQLNA